MARQAAKVREAVGVFDDYDELEGTIQELEVSGFGRHEISVLGNEMATKKKLDAPPVAPERLEDNPRAPRSPYIAAEELGVAKGVVMGLGMLAGMFMALMVADGLTVVGAIVTAMLAGIGGLAVGWVLAELLGEKYVDFFQKQIKQGGLLLWVRTSDKAKEKKAQDILKFHGARDVHIHQISPPR